MEHPNIPPKKKCRQVKPDFLERFATPLVKVTGGGKMNGRSAVMCYPHGIQCRWYPYLHLINYPGLLGKWQSTIQNVFFLVWEFQFFFLSLSFWVCQKVVCVWGAFLEWFWVSEWWGCITSSRVFVVFVNNGMYDRCRLLQLMSKRHFFRVWI